MVTRIDPYSDAGEADWPEQAIELAASELTQSRHKGKAAGWWINWTALEAKG